MRSSTTPGGAVYAPVAPVSSALAPAAPLTIAAGPGPNPNQQCNCQCTFQMNPSGLPNDNRPREAYIFVLILLSIISFASLIVLSVNDELAVVEASTSGANIKIRFGLSEIEATVTALGVTQHGTESYSHLCKDDVSWCNLHDKADGWFAFWVYGMVMSVTTISMISSVVCCLPPGGCCACNNCCSTCVSQTCCRGLCIKNTGVYFMIGICMVQLIGCFIWAIDNPITSDDICEEVDNCEISWGSAWWMGLTMGIVNLICAGALASKNTWKCR